MKRLFVFSVLVTLVAFLNACNKNAVDPAATNASARTAGVSSTSANGPHSLTAVDAATLPAAVTTYITTNYTGATVKEAFKDAQGNYVVAITVNSTIKVLKFTADGTFVKVLEGKGPHAPGDSAHHPKGDSLQHMHGDSAHHPKGDSTHHAPGDTLRHPRPEKGPGLTTVATTSLPAAITAYINSNYAGATISKAVQETTTSDYIIHIKTTDNKVVILVFGSDGTFKKAIKGK